MSLPCPDGRVAAPPSAAAGGGRRAMKRRFTRLACACLAALALAGCKREFRPTQAPPAAAGVGQPSLAAGEGKAGARSGAGGAADAMSAHFMSIARTWSNPIQDALLPAGIQAGHIDTL